MDLHFYFDTAVLGPTYEDGYRHLVLSVSAAWEADMPPEDQSREQVLLQPWFWKEAECKFKLYHRKGAVMEEVLDALLERVELQDDWSPGEDMVKPARNKLVALYDRCAKKEENSHHDFRLGLKQDEQDEDPDSRNRQCWPDLLASAGRWPGLLPYRLKLQYAFRVSAPAIVADALYFIVPVQVSTEAEKGVIVKTSEPAPNLKEQGAATVEYNWQQGPGPTGIAEGRLGGNAMPLADRASGALLDLHTLWGRSDQAGGWTSHDWFAAVPGLVAEACDHPDALFDALSQLLSAEAGAPDLTKPLQQRFEQQAQREMLIAFALQAWTLRYGVLTRVGSDGGHPLTSILSALPGDAYDAERWGDVLASLASQTMPALDAVIAAHNASAEEQSLRILPIKWTLTADGKLMADGNPAADGLDKRSGLDFLHEAARTFAWLTSDAGLFALYATPWLEAVKLHAKAHPGSNVPKALQDWLKSEKRDSFPLGAMVRGAWCTNGDNVKLLGAPKPLRAVVEKLHDAPTSDPKGTLVALLSNVDDDPVPPNAPLRDYLVASDIRADAPLFDALARALRMRVEALRRSHLDGSARALPDVPLGYPAAFGDPWPLDRVHDLMLPIDRPGHVDSDDTNFEDLRRQIAGIGLLVRQAGKPWHCLASASILPEGAEALRYAALSGQPSAFAGELRTTMVAYRGEPWFEGNVDAALAIGYGGEPEADSALTDVRTVAHPAVKFPDLKFGQRYFCKPFIIGPGNALPSALCARNEGERLHPAHPRKELFSSSGITADVLETGFGPFHYLRRVPVGAPLLAPGESDTLFSRREDVHPLAHEVLAATTPSEEPLTLLCPSQQWRGKAKHIFHLQPPEVDMMVWLRHWRALISAKDGGVPGEQWPEQLRKTLATWMEQADAIAAQPEGAKSLPKFHDPAHDAYLIEVEQVWPTPDKQSQSRIFRVEGVGTSPAAAAAPDGQTRAMTVRIDADGAADPLPDKPMFPPTIDNRNGEIVVSGFYKGHVYRVSASALVKAERFAGYDDVDKDVQGKKIFAPVEIFGRSVGAAQDAAGYIRFAPRTFLAEVAIEEMPDASTLRKALAPAFDGRMLTVAADFSKAAGNGWRYVRTLMLERQRWAWSGRHVDQSQVVELVSGTDGSLEKAAFEPKTPKPFEDWGFLDRTDDYVREFAASAANDPRTVIWREDLQSRRAAEYHRFRLRARSRYAGLMQDQTQAESFTQIWAPFALKFRPGATALPRPKIAMVLPLTAGYDDVESQSGESTLDKRPRKLACLVQLEESAFDEAGLPERIVVTAEMAGPDPILIQARPTSALELDCKTHGPIGHSFDPDLPGAKYRRASWVVSFDTPAEDAATGHPWPLVKLRVRREVPKGWVWPLPQNDLESEAVSAGWIQLPRPSDQILVRDGSQNAPRQIVASGLRLRRGPSDVSIVYDGTTEVVALDREPGFDGLFPVLTYQVIDARGIPGSERIIDINAFDIGKPGPIQIAPKALQAFERAPPGSLRLRLLTVQQNPRKADDRPTACHSLSELFARVGDEDTSDAWFRLMRVSLPIEEA